MACRVLRSRRVHLVRDRIRTSLWLAPSIGVAAAIALAMLLVSVDPRSGFEQLGWFLFDGGPESARELLSTIASAMLTFTALVFSITVLVLQLASNQFSPRVIRTFLQARMTKLTMAIFVGTFAYTTVVLSQIRTDPAFVPSLATWCALAFAIASVAVFIEYVHHISHAVRAIMVIENIAAETRHTIDELCPERLPAAGAARRDVSAPPGPPDAVLDHSGNPGILAAVDRDRLVELARAADAVIEIVPQIGQFIPTGTPLFRVRGEPVEDEAARAAVAIEPERTPVQDPGFGFRQLVDIAVRALSPGVNDPTTAVQALDHLHDLLRRLTTRELPQGLHRDRGGALRLITAECAYADYVALAFDEPRHYGAAMPRIERRIRRAIEDCLVIAPPERRPCLEDQLAMLDRARRAHQPQPRASTQGTP